MKTLTTFGRCVESKQGSHCPHRREGTGETTALPVEQRARWRKQLPETIFPFTPITAGEGHGTRACQPDAAPAGELPTRPDWPIRKGRPGTGQPQDRHLCATVLEKGTWHQCGLTRAPGLDAFTKPGFSRRPDPQEDNATATAQPEDPGEVGSHSHLLPSKVTSGRPEGFAIEATRTQEDTRGLFSLR